MKKKKKLKKKKSLARLSQEKNEMTDNCIFYSALGLQAI